MKQRRKLKRRRRKKLRKWVKVFIIAVLAIALLVVAVIFGFKLQKVDTKLDLGQFTNKEVNDYIKKEGIDNTLWFWIKNKTGHSDKLELFEDYTVKMNSPFKVTITAYEKKLKGYINVNKIYYYFDENGVILKQSTEKIKGIPKITGVECNNLTLYKKMDVKNKKVLENLLDVTTSIQEYKYNVKRIDVNKDAEATMYVKNVAVQLGKNSNLDKKLRDFNDMYDNIIKYKGTLNMKFVSEDGSYTLKKADEKSK